MSVTGKLLIALCLHWLLATNFGHSGWCHCLACPPTPFVDACTDTCSTLASVQSTSAVSSNHPHTRESRLAYPTLCLARLCPHLSSLLRSTIPLVPPAITTILVASCSHLYGSLSAGRLNCVVHPFCGSCVSHDTLSMSGGFFLLLVHSFCWQFLLKQYYWLHSGTATPAHLLCSGRVRKVVVESQEVLYYVSEKPLYIYTNSVTVWHVTSNTYSTVRTITNMCLHYIWVEVPATCVHSSDGSCKVHTRLQQCELRTIHCHYQSTGLDEPTSDSRNGSGTCFQSPCCPCPLRAWRSYSMSVYHRWAQTLRPLLSLPLRWPINHPHRQTQLCSLHSFLGSRVLY